MDSRKSLVTSQIPMYGSQSLVTNLIHMGSRKSSVKNKIPAGQPAVIPFYQSNIISLKSLGRHNYFHDHPIKLARPWIP